MRLTEKTLAQFPGCCFIGENLFRYTFWTASVCYHLPTETFSQCLADGGQVVVVKQVIFENLKKWPCDTHTHTHTLTHTHGGDTQAAAWTVSKSEGFFFFRAASSRPSGDLSAVAALGQQGGVVTGTGSPGQCLAPPPARPLWRPSCRGRSRWWGVRPPFSRSCSVRDDRGKRSSLCLTFLIFQEIIESVKNHLFNFFKTWLKNHNRLPVWRVLQKPTQTKEV